MMTTLKTKLLTLLLLLSGSTLMVACNGNGNNTATNGTATEATPEVAKLPIAYIQVDSLMQKYQYSLDVQEEILRKMEDAQATINQHGRALEQEMRDFQRKVENNAFFDQSRAQREQQRILKKQEEFQALNQRLSAEVAEYQLKLQKALSDTIFSQVNQYNAEIGKYHMILTNTGVLVVDKSYDITEEVVKYLNNKYTPATPATSDTPKE